MGVGKRVWDCRGAATVGGPRGGHESEVLVGVTTRNCGQGVFDLEMGEAAAYKMGSWILR